MEILFSLNQLPNDNSPHKLVSRLTLALEGKVYKYEFEYARNCYITEGYLKEFLLRNLFNKVVDELLLKEHKLKET